LLEIKSQKKNQKSRGLTSEDREDKLFLSRVTVTLRKSILDPQGKAVEHGVHSLGYDAIEDVRIGKFIELKVNVPTKQKAEDLTRDVCQKLLSNPVMEDFSFTVDEMKESHGKS